MGGPEYKPAAGRPDRQRLANRSANFVGRAALQNLQRQTTPQAEPVAVVALQGVEVDSRRGLQALVSVEPRGEKIVQQGQVVAAGVLENKLPAGILCTCFGMLGRVNDNLFTELWNLNRSLALGAGAGLPGHLHIHLVPRWDCDTNLMNVCSGTDFISQSLTELLEVLKDLSKEHNLPSL